MSFYTEKRVKMTRKEQRCRWCSEMVLKGDPSIVGSGVWEGDFSSSRFHPECSPNTIGFSGEYPYDRMKRGENKEWSEA